MDTELLKTFLELQRTRHFGRAAENLHLTQSAVSARIRLLEEILGTPLFNRARNNLHLTPSGQRLVQHAETILDAWARARHELEVADDGGRALTIGASPSLWDVLLRDWLVRLAETRPELAITVEAQGDEVLLRRLVERTLDLAFSFEAPQLAEIRVRPVARLDLVMVSTHPGLDCSQALARGDYALVDWGTGFALAHAQAFPELPPPRLRFGLGRLALDFVTARGGTLYLPTQMVANEIIRGRLYRVADAPVMKRDAYALNRTDSDRDGTIGALLVGMPPTHADAFDIAEATVPGPAD